MQTQEPSINPSDNESHQAQSLCIIIYTTLYREGGAQLALAAETLAEACLAQEIQAEQYRVESKAEFVDVFHQLSTRGALIKSLYFFGHSGMYGPMFRSTDMPEQLSPHEWRTLVGKIPFTTDGEAYFHACRTARWFAPFFARTFNVPCSGFHEYTTFSSDPIFFKWPGLRPQKPLYLMGCLGKKSGGILASVRKYLGASLEAPKRFLPQTLGDEASYARVASLYDEVFSDIRVRRDEWTWLIKTIQKYRHVNQLSDSDPCQVLDLGCGNGSLLAALLEEGYITQGRGVDSSPQMIDRACERQAKLDDLQFEVIDEPRLPVADGSVDLVISLLSWRYMDWDPLMLEIIRVIKPGGRLLVIDMVTAVPNFWELPKLFKDGLKAKIQQKQNPTYQRALRTLTQDPAWTDMLRYNPIRARHELVWYFESRFQGRKVETLNLGRRAQILAFDSGPIDPKIYRPPQSYP